MARSTIHDNPDYFLHDNDPIDLDAVDEFGYKDGINDRIGLIHTPDVDCDADHKDDNFAYGVDKHQYQVNGRVDEVQDEERRINHGKVNKSWYSNGELRRSLNDILRDIDGEYDE